MAIKLYVGNLALEIDQKRLENIFAPFGTVDSATLMKDGDTGRSKGYAFVEMACNEAALNAMENLNGTQHSGQAINVTEVKTPALHAEQSNSSIRRWLS